VNSLAQSVGKEVLNETAYLQKTRQLIIKERNFLSKGLIDIKGIKVFPAKANFLLCRLDDSVKINSLQLSEAMHKHSLMIRSCHNFKGLSDRFFRIAVRSRLENKSLLKALALEVF